MINPNEAPEGYRAVEPEVYIISCVQCAFNIEECPKISCFRDKRKDGQDVIFKEKGEGE